MINNKIDEEENILLALNFVEGLGAIKINLLLSKYSSAIEVYNQTEKELKSCSFLNPKIIKQIINKETFNKADKEKENCYKQKIEIISFRHHEYPNRLLEIEDKPIIIYKKGKIYPTIKKSIAFVGTRNSTEYGHKFIENSLQRLSEIPDLTTVSGLALGIDQKAHFYSIKNNIPTIAIMGVALNSIFPATNTNLAHSILDNNGGWISETSTQDKVVAGMFPRRNRLIAAMCDVLVVVESKAKGGSIITAKLANGYNKEVYALPGRISDALSFGCNELIRKNNASIINNIDDLITDLNWSSNSNINLNNTIPIQFEGSIEAKKILEIIRTNPSIDIEKLVLISNVNIEKLPQILIELELDGFITPLPGNRYEII